MSPQLKASTKRVQDFLTERGKDFEIKHMPDSTRTAVEAAEAIGCSVSQIAKSLIFRDDLSDDAILIVASGTNMVCLDKVEEATGLKLGKADANFVRDKVGFAIGGVSPVGHTSEVVTLLDIDLQQYDEIWAAAGTPHAVFKLSPLDLDELTKGKWLDVAK
jgi:prolyl-tRNA editing enzyme YbaK/EbsC (Cys-tRNA(Pro) deacylase)